MERRPQVWAEEPLDKREMDDYHNPRSRTPYNAEYWPIDLRMAIHEAFEGICEGGWRAMELDALAVCKYGVASW